MQLGFEPRNCGCRVWAMTDQSTSPHSRSLHPSSTVWASTILSPQSSPYHHSLSSQRQPSEGACEPSMALISLREKTPGLPVIPSPCPISSCTVGTAPLSAFAFFFPPLRSLCSSYMHSSNTPALSCPRTFAWAVSPAWIALLVDIPNASLPQSPFLIAVSKIPPLPKLPTLLDFLLFSITPI